MARKAHDFSEPIGQLICLAVGCPAPIERGKVFCPRHWALLPDKNRRLLVDTWTPRFAQCVEWGSAVSAAIAVLKAADRLR